MSVEVFQPSRPATADVINHIANHDVKAMVYIALAGLGESTVKELADEVDAHTSVASPMRSFIKSYVVTYTNAGFASRRLAASGHGQQAAHYTAKRENEALPLLETVLEWSEEQDLSLIPVLSVTNTKGETRGPFNTIQLFDGLLKGLNVCEMELPKYKGAKNWGIGNSGRLRSLIDAGLVTEKDPNEFQILDPTYRGTRPFRNLRPETRAVYQVLAAGQLINPDKTWTISEVIELAKKMMLIDASQVGAFREVLTTALSDRAPRSLPGVITKLHIEPRLYRIADHFIEPVHDLVERVRTIDSAGAQTRGAAADKARALYKERAVASRIIQRGIDNSLQLKSQLASPEL